MEEVRANPEEGKAMDKTTGGRRGTVENSRKTADPGAATGTTRLGTPVHKVPWDGTRWPFFLLLVAKRLPTGRMSPGKRASCSAVWFSYLSARYSVQFDTVSGSNLPDLGRLSQAKIGIPLSSRKR